MPSLPELTEPLTDGTVALRQAAERDIPEILIAFQDDPHLHERLGLERPPSGAQLGQGFEEAEAARLSGSRLGLAILRAGSDDCVGQLSVQRIEWMHARAELGIWLAPHVRGQGLAARALRLAGPWLLQRARLERLQMITEPDNEAMLAAARAAGFKDEGILRAYTFERGKRVDCAILSLLPSDL